MFDNNCNKNIEKGAKKFGAIADGTTKKLMKNHPLHSHGHKRR